MSAYLYYTLTDDHQVVPTTDRDAASWDIAKRRVAETTLPNGIWISTVFLPIDMGFGHETDSPLVFESMVFPSEYGRTELDTRRYHTWAEAEAGHAALVAKWKEIPSGGDPQGR